MSGGVTPTKKNRPGMRRWKNEKSSAPVALGTTSMPMGRGPVLATRVNVGTICSVSTGSLRVTG